MRRNQLLFLLSTFLFGGSLFLNCSTENKRENPYLAEMDPRTRMRFRQYMINGQRLYNQHCLNCHGLNGEGLEQLIPPLAKSDYLMADIDRAICQVRFGRVGEIIVNGRTFNQPMPENKKLRALEIAEIITYVTNSWGNQSGFISVKDAEKSLNGCK